MIRWRQLQKTTSLSMSLLIFLLLTETTAASTEEISTEPCESPNYRILDDRRRSPLYQPKSPRDLLCDHSLEEGWYRFQINNRSAQMPTQCAPVNYCGTQAPIWLNLEWQEDEDFKSELSTRARRQLPRVKGGEGSYTLCTAWSLPGLEEDTDCCFMTTPTVVRNCGDFFVYYLRPTVSCNMAYCAEEKDEHRTFAFDDQPRIKSVVTGNQVFLSCSVKTTVPVPLRFNWYKVSLTDGSQLKLRSQIHKSQTYDTIARHQLHMGDQVYCEVEALLDVTHHNQVLNPSTISDAMTLGLRIDPTYVELNEGDIVGGTYRNSIQISATVPFLCSPHVSQHDCHLTLRFKSRIQDASPFRPPDIALSACTLKFNASHCNDDNCGRAELNIAALVDYFEEGAVTTTIEVSVESYGDPFWHGYKASNITIQVVDQVINRCSAYTSGHVITFKNTLRTVTQAGTYKLYQSLTSDPLRRLEVMAHFKPCPHELKSKINSVFGALCICGIDAQQAGNRFTIDSCDNSSLRRATSKRKYYSNLPIVKLTTRNGTASATQHTARIWESRKGSLLRVLFPTGNQIRIRLEPFGLSVTIAVLSRSKEVEGLCNPRSLAWSPPVEYNDYNKDYYSVLPTSSWNDSEPFFKPFCSCTGLGNYGKRYMATRMAHASSLSCNPLYEECYSKCNPLAYLQFQPLVNYVDVTSEVLERDEPTLSPYSNTILSVSQDVSTWLQFNNSVNALEAVGVDFESKRRKHRAHDNLDKPNLSMGNGVHWLAPQKRKRRSNADELEDNEILAWDDDTTSSKSFDARDELNGHYFCSNLLVNSTVGVECERHLSDIITLAIDICIEDIRLHNSTEWATYAMGLLEDVCELEVIKDTLHWRKDRSGRLVAPKAIVEILNCPNACSGHGVCLEHGCICQPGFHGQDCGRMEERPPSLASGQSLCDLRVRNCSLLTLQGHGFINSHFLTCKYWQGRYHGEKWIRSGAGHVTQATWLSTHQVACLLPMNHVEALELTIEIEVSNDGQAFSESLFATIYNGKCRTCVPATKDSPLTFCTDREDICYINDDCFEDKDVNPLNSCEACLLLNNSEGWSSNPENQPPQPDETTFEVRVYDGQLLRHQLLAWDPENNTVSFMFLDAQDYVSDIKLTRNGLVEWRALSNALQVTTVEEFTIQIADACNATTTAQLRIEVLPCPCLNNGQCQEVQRTGDLLVCHCSAGFTGALCEERIDYCTPNPCQNGGNCLSTGINFTCTCLPQFTGPKCEKRRNPCVKQPCFQGVQCTTLPFDDFQGNGTTNQWGNQFNVDYVCGPCPSGMQGDGKTCTDIDDCTSLPCFAGVPCYDKPAPDRGFYCGNCPPNMTGDGIQCLPEDLMVSLKSKCKTNNCKKKGRKHSRKEWAPQSSTDVLPSQSRLMDVVTMQTEDNIIYLPDNVPSVMSSTQTVFEVIPYRAGSTTPMPKEWACEAPCENRGKCVFPGVCRCRTGYSGPQCSMQKCRPPCLNGGRCLGRNRCQCQPGTTGLQCERLKPTCQPICQNGGECLEDNTCSCLPGWKGSHCEIPVCNIPCQNHGLCVRPNKCSCLPGYRGRYCQKPSCKPKCRNGGKCIGPNQCQCKANFSGPQCESSIQLPPRRSSVSA